ncbi:hypothetical protein AVEN_101663-1 [Araneus ventricosus]|uniref:Uncharacterized protein n=1 Tax=Araneus ventricosus TaxID=182803 RepID=A0A4Y2GMF4_ARAVE|nr:hypothetical protein AVEN_101663-1 [Araneus ventricosus]
MHRLVHVQNFRILPHKEVQLLPVAWHDKGLFSPPPILWLLRRPPRHARFLSQAAIQTAKRDREISKAGLPCRVNVHEKQEANSAPTASDGELPRLPSRDGREQQKAEGEGEGKLEGSKDPWVPRDWDTRTHLKKLSP